LVNISPGTPVKTNANVRIFTYMHPPTPANSPQDLRGYWTKVHKIFIRLRGIIGGVSTGTITHVSTPPNNYRMPAERMKIGRHKSVTIATSLDRAVAI